MFGLGAIRSAVSPVLTGALFALLITPAHANMDLALGACLDRTVGLDERAEIFLANDWSQERDPTFAYDVYFSAAFLATASALDFSTWDASRAQAESFAQNTHGAIADGVSTLLVAPEEESAIVLGRNAVGLQTCMYVGADQDLGPVAEILDGSFLRTIGPVTRIRGDGPRSSIVAHLIEDGGASVTDMPVAYSSSFTIVLDRQVGDVR
ncbi:MAG: hypothetical protein AAGO57_00055 [Pseudomonadota bacterium]